MGFFIFESRIRVGATVGMIRLIHPVLHTKFLNPNAVRSIYLWWTPAPYVQKHKAFLQFESWIAGEKGAEPRFDLVWNYPCFQTARQDLETILDRAPWITPIVCQYQHAPSATMGVQPIGDAPPSTRAALIALNGLLPKNPL